MTQAIRAAVKELEQTARELLTSLQGVHQCTKDRSMCYVVL